MPILHSNFQLWSRTKLEREITLTFQQESLWQMAKSSSQGKLTEVPTSTWRHLKQPLNSNFTNKPATSLQSVRLRTKWRSRREASGLWSKKDPNSAVSCQTILPACAERKWSVPFVVAQDTLSSSIEKLKRELERPLVLSVHWYAKVKVLWVDLFAAR